MHSILSQYVTGLMISAQRNVGSLEGDAGRTLRDGGEHRLNTEQNHRGKERKVKWRGQEAGIVVVVCLRERV